MPGPASTTAFSVFNARRVLQSVLSGPDRGRRCDRRRQRRPRARALRGVALDMRDVYHQLRGAKRGLMFLRCLHADVQSIRQQKEHAMGLKRGRFKQTDSLEARFEQFAQDMRKRADGNPAEDERNALLKRARNADQGIDIQRQLRQEH
jgi:hypothetical protein